MEKIICSSNRRMYIYIIFSVDINIYIYIYILKLYMQDNETIRVIYNLVLEIMK
jgi:hypothetical protein